MASKLILGIPFSAVVFDCDGTLMDTEHHWIEARRVVLADRGITPGSDFSARTKGMHYSECGRLMAEMCGRPEKAAEVTERLLDEFRKLVVADAVTVPGAVKFVELAAELAPLAVASNCPRDIVETCLESAGLLHHFSRVVVPEGRIRPKPHPDPYATAARLCGADPGASLAVEDSMCGVHSALAAGLRVIGVGPEPPTGVEGVEMVEMWVERLDDPALLAPPSGGAAVVPPRRAEDAPDTAGRPGLPS
ncbi:HAD family hydrolase [Streptomyces alkaliphilus]|uniref:HAD family hydrolase n=1 Tax=Streptomyces alkaliphilus TaxID=1472722 RepID=UPI00117FA3E0|nr:HAD family phosphatase [Streptomyces alkaliphilus]MQS06509.1 HAD-IA family hydrolase [Streptomyces alkaliphilus]